MGICQKPLTGVNLGGKSILRKKILMHASENASNKVIISLCTTGFAIKQLYVIIYVQFSGIAQP